MNRPLLTLLVALVLGLTGCALPAVALAAGGGSAGNQQYTDPFGGSSGTPTSHGTPTPTPTPAPATTTPAPATTTPPPTATTPTATTPSGPVTPTATAATTPSGSGTSAKTLPYTGYDGGLVALLGAGLVLGGAGLRIRLRRS